MPSTDYPSTAGLQGCTSARPASQGSVVLATEHAADRPTVSTRYVAFTILNVIEF